MNTGKENVVIAQAIVEKRLQIVSCITEQIHPDPIYQMRFGSSWDQLILEDIQADLDNLVLAVQFDLIDSPAKHYRYQQNIAVGRGRCTRLIHETILALHDCIDHLLAEQSDAVQPFFDSALEGIAYADPGGIVVNKMADLIAEGARENLAKRFPDASLDSNWRAERLRELELSVSYLADSLERKAPRLFWDFVDWIAAYHARACLDAKVIDQELNALSKEITRLLEPAIARRLRPIIYRVRRSI